ncbi:hypothetical protein M422DRAFT_262344 [Sphaerobolus stellatus SS14]|uniref:Uncharacterized protein n=1 Tax=Sphaerobolus stellatus (strain SS14) TaxID=990650 RepID=A0A0C9TY22_SPHS4|nr:hypothetical protein M422DRAFT_262344 [Sphaerobolus stellatus SS14]
MANVRKDKDPLEDPRYTSEYPLGTHPSWTEIMEILDSNPSVIVGPLRNINFWKDSPSTTDSLVIVPLAKWSSQYIFAMNQTFLADQVNYPLLETWEDILRFWSIAGIQSLVHTPAFQPHKSYWKGLPPGPQQATFAQRYKTFFPPLSVKFSTTSYWNYFLEYGYMKDYHDILRTKTEEEILNLTDSLKAAFDCLQCLPSRSPNSTSQAWIYDDEKGGPCFIVNAKGYKLLAIGARKPQRRDVKPRAVAAHTHIQSLLVADKLNIPVTEVSEYLKGERREARKANKRSARQKNYRKPPPCPRGHTSQNSMENTRDDISKTDWDQLTKGTEDDELEEDGIGIESEDEVENEAQDKEDMEEEEVHETEDEDMVNGAEFFSYQESDSDGDCSY